MNLLGLATSAALLYAYNNKQNSDNKKSLIDILPTPEEYGVDINYTPMPDNLYFKTTIRVVSVSSDSCKVKIYVYIKNTDSKKPIYINSIAVNGCLFGKYFYFSNKPTRREDCNFNDYSIQYTPAMCLRYSTYGRMFGVGECKGLTKDEVRQIREAVADGKHDKQDFANVDLLIRWSYLPKGDTTKAYNEQWIKGVSQGIQSTLTMDSK